MHDKITLTGVRAHGYHGVLDFEKRDGQEFIVDAVLHGDFTAAAASDDLSLTTNYAEVAQLIHDRITGEGFDLIETLAVRIAEEILGSQPLVAAVEVTVHKPHAPIQVPFGSVSVSVARSRTVSGAGTAKVCAHD